MVTWCGWDGLAGSESVPRLRRWVWYAARPRRAEEYPRGPAALPVRAARSVRASRAACSTCWPQAPNQATFPTSGAMRRVSSCVRISGKTAPSATGTSVRPISSNIRSAWRASSSRQALPVTTVIPRTSTCGDCSSAIIDMMFEPPGPEVS